MTLRRYLSLPHVKVAATAVGTNMIDDAPGPPGAAAQRRLDSAQLVRDARRIADTDLVAAMPGRWASDPAFSAGCVWHRLPLEELTFAVDLRWRTRDALGLGHRWLREVITWTMNEEAA